MNKVIFEVAMPFEASEHAAGGMLEWTDAEVYARIDWRQAGQALPAGAVPLRFLMLSPDMGEGDGGYRQINFAPSQWFSEEDIDEKVEGMFFAAIPDPLKDVRQNPLA
jgi:hypothetical protein